MSYRLVRTEDLPVVREIMNEYRKESETYRNHRVDVEGFLANLARSITVGDSLTALVYEEEDGEVTQVAVLNTSFYYADLSKLTLSVVGVFTVGKCSGNFYKFLTHYAEVECYDYILTGYRADEDKPKAHNRMLTRQGYKPLTHTYIKEVSWPSLH